MRAAHLLSNKTAKQLSYLDILYNYSRHVTSVGASSFVSDVISELRKNLFDDSIAVGHEQPQGNQDEVRELRTGLEASRDIVSSMADKLGEMKDKCSALESALKSVPSVCPDRILAHMQLDHMQNDQECANSNSTSPTDERHFASLVGSMRHPDFHDELCKHLRGCDLTVACRSPPPSSASSSQGSIPDVDLMDAERFANFLMECEDYTVRATCT